MSLCSRHPFPVLLLFSLAYVAQSSLTRSGAAPLLFEHHNGGIDNGVCTIDIDYTLPSTIPRYLLSYATM